MITTNVKREEITIYLFNTRARASVCMCVCLPTDRICAEEASQTQDRLSRSRLLASSRGEGALGDHTGTDLWND